MNDLDKIFLASDHAGFDVKVHLNAWLAEHYKGVAIEDLGPMTADSVDYPDYAQKLGQAVVTTEQAGQRVIGIGLCGSGLGISMSLNKVKGIRAALCHDVTTARLAREHNHANVIALGTRVLGLETIQDCIARFIATKPNTAERHARRVEKIEGGKLLFAL